MEDDLLSIAAPRIGKILLISQDNTPIYRAESTEPFPFGCTLGATLFGAYFSAMIIEKNRFGRSIPNFNPDAKVLLRLESFLTQKVLCVWGQWISRRAVLKYMANIASGVHSGSPQTGEELAIARARCAAWVKMEDNIPAVTFNGVGLEDGSPEPKYGPDLLDPVLLEVFATAHFLVSSPLVSELEEIIRKEVSSPSDTLV